MSVFATIRGMVSGSIHNIADIKGMNTVNRMPCSAVHFFVNIVLVSWFMFIRHKTEENRLYPSGTRLPGSIRNADYYFFGYKTFPILVLLDVLRRAQNGSAQGCGLISCGVEVIKHHFLQVGLYFLHLSEDDPSLSLDLCSPQCAVLDDVC
uniref:Uncharacterized protein n=1 Tax=Oncorhynchus kisutch TaxID=8019 RepID=A0A8C7KJ60_ONCKI